MTVLASRLLAAAVLALGAAAAEAADAAVEAAASYRIETAGTTASLRSGEKGLFVLSIVPLAKVHVHPAAPLKIALEATPGLKLEKTSLGKADPVDPKADGRRFEVPFAAQAVGKQEIRANVQFFICSDQWCVKQVKDVTAAVDAR
ncbi:MAG TPA: hypothetical protein VGB87_05740 [Vicinamibacteria bacterium]